MARQRADQRPGSALRAKGGVDRPDRALGRVLGAHPHQRWSASSRRRPSDARPRRCPGHGLGDEDDVDVADVVQLPAAALAHRDHRQPARRRVRRQPGPGHRQRGLQRRGSQVGELGGDDCDVEAAGQVAGRERQHAPTVRDAQRVERGPDARAPRPGVRADRTQHRALSSASVGAAPRLEATQVGPVLGVAREMVAEGRRSAPQHGSQPVPQRHVVAQRGDQQRRRSGAASSRRPEAAQGPSGSAAATERVQQTVVVDDDVGQAGPVELACSRRDIGETGRASRPSRLADDPRPAPTRRRTYPLGAGGRSERNAGRSSSAYPERTGRDRRRGRDEPTSGAPARDRAASTSVSRGPSSAATSSASTSGWPSAPLQERRQRHLRVELDAPTRPRPDPERLHGVQSGRPAEPAWRPRAAAATTSAFHCTRTWDSAAGSPATSGSAGRLGPPADVHDSGLAAPARGVAPRPCRRRHVASSWRPRQIPRVGTTCSG